MIEGAPMTKMDPRAIRLKADRQSTQKGFAAVLGVPTKTVSNWEQGRPGRAPAGAALTLLELLNHNPALYATLKALRNGNAPAVQLAPAQASTSTAPQPRATVAPVPKPPSNGRIMPGVQPWEPNQSAAPGYGRG